MTAQWCRVQGWGQAWVDLEGHSVMTCRTSRKHCKSNIQPHPMSCCKKVGGGALTPQEGV